MGAHQQKMMGKVALLFVVAMAAGANGCYCGTGNVFVAATKFCSTAWTTTGQELTTAACAANVLDGSTATTPICSCGTGNVQIAAGKFTFLKTDKTCIAEGTASIQACASTDGSGAAPTNGCYCGTGNVVTAANKFCSTAWTTTGQELTTAACVANVLDGSTGTTPICSCGTGNTQIAAGKYTFLKTDNTCPAEGAAQVGITCSGTMADGSTATTASTAGSLNCYCGTSKTLTTTGKFCYSGTTIPAGLITDHCFLAAATSGAATTGVSSIMLLAVALLALRQ